MLFLAKVIARLSRARQRRVRNLLKGKADPRDGVRRPHGYNVPVRLGIASNPSARCATVEAVDPRTQSLNISAAIQLRR